MKWLCVAAASLLLAFPGVASAENYIGRIDVLNANYTAPTTYRAFVRTGSLSLFADGAMADILVGAFYRKASVSVGYDVIACTGGVTGVCGRVRSVTVDVTAVP